MDWNTVKPEPGAHAWAAWRRILVRAACVMVLVGLGGIRGITGAEFAFASIAILPVLVIAWSFGRAEGLLFAALAALLLTAGEITSGYEFSAQWIPWVNGLTRMLTFGVMAVLMAQVRVQLQREHESASHDVLTGLLNRRAFLQEGTVEVERSKRYRHPMAVVFLDLDDFKQLNDTRGHAAGDAALREAATGLRAALRGGDLVAKLGGDEFAVIVPEASLHAAERVSEKISESLARALEKYPPVKASIGIAWFSAVDRPFTEMLRLADNLMYEVKEQRKGTVLLRAMPALAAGDQGPASFGGGA